MMIASESHRFAPVAAHILTQPALAAMLAGERDGRALATRLLALATELGCALDADDLDDAATAVREQRAAWCEPLAWPAAQRLGWIVVGAGIAAQGQIALTWGRPASDVPAAFHQIDVASARFAPLHRWLAPSVALSADECRHLREAALPLRGVVHHLSRCGSTLLIQLLGCSDGVDIVSEAAPLDDMMQLYARGVVARETVEATLAALRLPRRERSRYCVIKADAWHLPMMRILDLSFDPAPAVFLYRDPVEVLVSHQREPATPAALFLLGAEPEFDAQRDAGDILIGTWAKALGTVCNAALETFGADPAAYLSYRDLPQPGLQRVLQRFGLAQQPFDDARADALCGLDAKRPQRGFVADSDDKQAAAGATLRAAAATWMQPPIARIEALRSA